MPLLLMMATGVLLNRTKLVSKDVFLAINRIVYYVGLPCLILHNLLNERGAGADWQVALLTVGGIVVLFVASWLLLPRVVSDNKRRGAITQAALRSNDSIFSLTVAASMVGAEHIGLTVFVAALSATAFNLMAIITLELNRGGKVRPLSFLAHIATNPIILSVAAGYLLRALNVTLPVVLQKPIDSFAGMVAPLGFLMLGGILSFRAVQKNRKALLCIVLTKLVLVPLLMTGLAILLGFRGLRLLTVLLIFAAPTAMASYPLAAALESDAELAGEAVAVTTACSLPTVFLFLTAFGGLL